MRGRAASLPLLDVRALVAIPWLLAGANHRFLLLLLEGVALGADGTLFVRNRFIKRHVHNLSPLFRHFFRIVQPVVPNRGRLFF